LDVPSSLPDVIADRELASLTIRQLMTNALKYSNPESPIQIRAVAENGFVKISVKDQGPGIPAREKSLIFERYYRLPQNAERVPGTGLGLHIARNIVEAHGGTIWVESQPGQGSEFFFTLPAKEHANERR
jgi:signal transduction histidine kinase